MQENINATDVQALHSAFHLAAINKEDCLLDMCNVEQRQIIKIPTINKFGEKCELSHGDS